ncbi:MAG: hypothetical protein ACD_57C00309G0002 [uncultured bacterium]|nr:MAG: hypothetical protein ACD_57C00309G0002 [uncultured bacterium]OGM74150.1 MAG: hypothetical protein A3H21_01735 [Candidatus Woesebacteria bacterium RIFCSPLOWO2_12_FULL_42_8]
MKMDIKTKPWWSYLEEDLQELLNQSMKLLTRVPEWKDKYHDYAFMVFPAAKAYEGFLKKLFYDLGFIGEDEYFGKRFRIGRALNPSLEEGIREKEGVYDKLVNFCHGKELADQLWDTWKQSRNLIFHWFPGERNAIGLAEAEDRFDKIVNAIDSAFEGCKVGLV